MEDPSGTHAVMSFSKSPDTRSSGALAGSPGPRRGGVKLALALA